MKLILVMVTSLDGRTTRGNEIDNHAWTSQEDQAHFLKIIENAKVIIMGSKTYLPAKNQMIHRDGRKRIVITRNPEHYKNEIIPNQLEFTNETPTQLIDRLSNEGHSEGFLVGGANTNTNFFKEKLVNEIWQTLEPKILGRGNGIVGDEKMTINLSLLNIQKLNDSGTLLLKYQINY